MTQTVLILSFINILSMFWNLNFDHCDLFVIWNFPDESGFSPCSNRLTRLEGLHGFKIHVLRSCGLYRFYKNPGRPFFIKAQPFCGSGTEIDNSPFDKRTPVVNPQ